MFFSRNTAANGAFKLNKFAMAGPARIATEPRTVTVVVGVVFASNCRNYYKAVNLNVMRPVQLSRLWFKCIPRAISKTPRSQCSWGTGDADSSGLKPLTCVYINESLVGSCVGRGRAVLIPGHADTGSGCQHGSRRRRRAS